MKRFAHLLASALIVVWLVQGFSTLEDALDFFRTLPRKDKAVAKIIPNPNLEPTEYYFPDGPPPITQHEPWVVFYPIDWPPNS